MVVYKDDEYSFSSGTVLPLLLGLFESYSAG